MKPARVYGWAVVHSDRIDVKTVAPTTRGAIVNHLYCNWEIPIYNFTTDEEIENLWERYKAGAEIKIVKIEILEEEI